jgi:hypothetical protein
MYQPPDGFLRGLREIADKNDLMLIFDEIQVGLGRTGKMFCFEENVIPMKLLGKAFRVIAFRLQTLLMDLPGIPLAAICAVGMMKKPAGCCGRI